MILQFEVQSSLSGQPWRKECEVTGDFVSPAKRAREEL